ncbi:AEC family transporter [Pseudodonghicola flavimaris]|uniref:AEC family transporter n=1 Tax=Pseudodonghicola flavimaris TaxID=3050036 RepID=A0ABT7EYC8_9RHOB|nr:AEC family transporter [Pseudodonghicola flavimaris]MDK3017361.1 AEC family transporter [Pseudodonghicola flavimaris]
MEFALSTLPILLTILCGYLVTQAGMVPRSQWEGINTLSFRLLIPVVLIRSIGFSDLSAVSGPWILAILTTFGVLAAAVLSLRLLIGVERLPNPAYTSLFQAATRWNAFVGLAAAELLVGGPALALLAVGMAVLVPLINVVNIVVLVVFGAGRANAKGIALSILRNPLVQGCIIGLALNAADLPLPEFVGQTLDLIGRAALGVGLLAVGAGIGLRRLFDLSGRLALGVLLRPVLSPLLFLTVAAMLGLSQVEALAGSLIFAVPAASNGYVVARQMGGDADLYADIITWQTLVSIGLMPALAAGITWMF